MFIRITKRIFKDLAIYMVFLGVIVGVVFPFFVRLFGVPASIAYQPLFFCACIAAGILLATLNITLARNVVGSRIRELSSQMKHVEGILSSQMTGEQCEKCTPESCSIRVDSEDELGDSAASFNRLIQTLSTVLGAQQDLQRFSEMLTSNLEMDVLANEILHYLLGVTQASGGAILTEEGAELNVEASYAIDMERTMLNSTVLHYAVEKQERRVVRLPEDIVLEGVLTKYRPKELLIEPIVYKQIVVGIIMLADVEAFSNDTLDKLNSYAPILSMAFNNAITHQRMQRLAALDALTGIYNRRFGSNRLQEEFGRAVRIGSSLSLIMLDIDHFKTVNDTYGHMVGDKLIVLITKIISDAIREGDVLIRYGGEEFLCVLPGASQQDAQFMAERIRIQVRDSILKNNEQEIRVTVSLGTSTYPNKDIDNIQQLINLSDEAMYNAKKSGRDRVASA
ncbi:MAG: GGDEF domain-containing protein [Eubacteriales bacterium]|nr:GGDEF domain-containing protein [Eubacteriales bacterium]